jgi:hypothetical protein
MASMYVLFLPASAPVGAVMDGLANGGGHIYFRIVVLELCVR